ncbi:hypothetical protein GCM10010471_19020 [Leucobacter komagatae]
MLVNLQAEANLLEDGVRLVAARFLGLLSCLVLELAKVHDLGNGRLRVRRNLNEIEIRLCSKAQRSIDRHDSDLLATGSYQSHLGNADSVIRTGIADRLLL